MTALQMLERRRHDSHALVVFGSVETPKGTLAADVIFEKLMADRRWFFRRFPRLLSHGSRVLFYQSAVGIRGEATVEDMSLKRTDVLAGSLVCLPFGTEVVLKDVLVYSEPVPLKDIVADLEFVKDKKYWGNSLRTSPRSISKRDYEFIATRARGQHDNA